MERFLTDGRTRFMAAWGGAIAALGALLLWARLLHPAYLWACAAVWAVAVVLASRAAPTGRDAEAAVEPENASDAGAAGDASHADPSVDGAGPGAGTGRRGTLPLLGALAVVLLGLLFGAATERRLDHLGRDWDALRAEHELRRTTELDRRMAVLVERGRSAVERAATRAAQPSGGDLSADLEALRDRTGVEALAVLDGGGDLLAWAGEHRGVLPARVRAGLSEVVYAERPLFSYLYFVSPVDGRAGRAVASVLLKTGLPRQHEASVHSFADRFAAAAGSRPSFEAGADAGAPWNLVVAGDSIVHARFGLVTQAEWRGDVAGDGRLGTLAAAGVALLLLLLAWVRGPTRGVVAPFAALAGVLCLAPLGPTLGVQRLFSPALFLLPAVGDLSLGTLLAVLVPLAALTAVRTARPREPSGWFGPRAAILLGCGVVAAGFAAGIHLLLDGAAPPLLVGTDELWGALQPAGVLALTVLTALALPRGRRGRSDMRRLPLFGGLALALALGALVVARWRVGQAVEPWLPALWAVPFAMIAVGIVHYEGRGRRLLRWLAAGWLAVSAVVPHLWIAHVGERLEAGEREIATLGTHADPFVDYLLRQFATDAIRRSARGEDDIELLYRAWVASGLARAAYPVHLTVWGPGLERHVELALSGAQRSRDSPRPSMPVLRRLLSETLEGGTGIVDLSRRVTGANEILAASLPDGRVVSAVVPPRRNLEQPMVLAAFLGSPATADGRLTLLPARTNWTATDRAVRWRTVEDGWRSEARVRYPEGDYHVHLELRAASPGVLFARGTLLLVLNLALLSVLWFAGRVIRGETPRPPGGWTAWLGSFRARVTLALFVFFLLPTALFGAIAYRALSGEVTRAARMVAERAAAQAVAAFPESGGDLTGLSERTGQEILYYLRGELAGASSPEAIGLGLYGAWMPPAVHRTLRSGEEPGAVEVRGVAGQPYLMAYRPLPAAGALAVPISLRTGDAAVRQQELAHLILFAVVMGAALSLALSLAVGRALARPIGRLRRAAGAIGGGRLQARLPERQGDEFGDLFASFNRMAERLQRARTQELRTARVLAWGEMARQVAHEIKNPLTPIKLSVQHLRRAYRDGRGDFDEILEGNVEQILSEIDQLTEIARAFSRYGLPPEAAGPLEPVDIGAVATEALTLYRAGDDAVDYRIGVDDGVGPGHARAGEVKEVVLNLVENARVAARDGGTVRVTVRRADDHIELAVSDDGAGIPPELLPRIFEPHFSTRSAGTGLGLAIVRRLVEGWGGAVGAESEAERGTTVRVRIPPAPVDTERAPA